MKKIRIDLWENGEYAYPLSFGFVPNIVSCLHDEDSTLRPGMLVVPGGGYCCVAPGEGGPVAEKFYSLGWNAFVLTYTTNLTMQAPLKDLPLREIARAVRLIRKNAEEYHIRPDCLAVCGFSAGGHLCGSLCVHYADAAETRADLKDISCRPDAAVLCYPVITSGPFAHRDSFTALLGENASEEELARQSLETQVTKDTPPAFLWQTAADELVPVENSFLYAKALRDAGIPCAYHVFSEGMHGLSLADGRLAEKDADGFYTEQQTEEVLKRIRDGRLPLREEKKQELLRIFAPPEEGNFPVPAPNPEAAFWPVLADAFLRTHLKI